MATKEQLRKLVKDNLDETIRRVNSILLGENLKSIRPVLERVGRGGKVPHWFDRLASDGVLPNLDGKSIGSVIEMVLIGVLEVCTFRKIDAPPLRVNPARGVDLPDLDLGVKSPSKNYCTSEPFFSAYERLYGSEYDCLVLLTDYQTAKGRPPLRLQIIKWEYVTKSQLADENLCRIAKKHRERLLKDGDSRAQRIFRFLAYVNQSDWLGKKLVMLVEKLDDPKGAQKLIEMAQLRPDEFVARKSFQGPHSGHVGQSPAGYPESYSAAGCHNRRCRQLGGRESEGSRSASERERMEQTEERPTGREDRDEFRIAVAIQFRTPVRRVHTHRRLKRVATRTPRMQLATRGQRWQ
jgi:hypothetical protein